MAGDDGSHPPPPPPPPSDIHQQREYNEYEHLLPLQQLPVVDRPGAPAAMAAFPPPPGMQHSYVPIYLTAEPYHHDYIHLLIPRPTLFSAAPAVIWPSQCQYATVAVLPAGVDHYCINPHYIEEPLPQYSDNHGGSGLVHHNVLQAQDVGNSFISASSTSGPVVDQLTPQTPTSPASPASDRPLHVLNHSRTDLAAGPVAGPSSNTTSPIRTPVWPGRLADNRSIFQHIAATTSTPWPADTPRFGRRPSNFRRSFSEMPAQTCTASMDIDKNLVVLPQPALDMSFGTNINELDEAIKQNKRFNRQASFRVDKYPRFGGISAVPLPGKIDDERSISTEEHGRESDRQTDIGDTSAVAMELDRKKLPVFKICLNCAQSPGFRRRYSFPMRSRDVDKLSSTLKDLRID